METGKRRSVKFAARIKWRGEPVRLRIIAQFEIEYRIRYCILQKSVKKYSFQ